ncbi:hypothetical protein LCGC14_0850570 [marine sediment metagenome]|uniref:Uncharacterized protein n=1 Tax=marine sediment metagenome TaxID=412755 RepID=A0A0F9PFC2_9ZZZZ
MTNRAKMPALGLTSLGWRRVTDQALLIIKQHPSYGGWFLRSDYRQAQDSIRQPIQTGHGFNKPTRVL